MRRCQNRKEDRKVKIQSGVNLGSSTGVGWSLPVPPLTLSLYLFFFTFYLAVRTQLQNLTSPAQHSALVSISSHSLTDTTLFISLLTVNLLQGLLSCHELLPPGLPAFSSSFGLYCVPRKAAQESLWPVCFLWRSGWHPSLLLLFSLLA